MSWDTTGKYDKIPESEIRGKVTKETVNFAEKFGKYLAEGNDYEEALTTSQLRRFFGEVKRQQMNGYDETDFQMLKPKLAYAVGRAEKASKKSKRFKIRDFYEVMVDAIDKVGDSEDKDKAFRNFISVFEAIVAYHKAAENK